MRSAGRCAVVGLAMVVALVARTHPSQAQAEEPAPAPVVEDEGEAAAEPAPAPVVEDEAAAEPAQTPVGEGEAMAADTAAGAPAPAASAPADVDWSAAPLPTEASGIARPADQGAQWPRTVGRVVLFVPKWAFIIVASPVRLTAWSYERYQLRDRFKQVFFNYDGTFGVYPVAFFATGFGLNAGARLVHKDLFGDGESLRLKAGFGGIYQQVYELSVGTGERLGERFELSLSGRFERRGKDKFYGIGNVDLGAEPGLMLDASASPGARSRFRQDVMRALVLGDLHLAGNVSAKLSGALLLRDLDGMADDEEDDIADNYDVTTLAGFEQGVTSLYGELELRYDSRRRASMLQTHAVPAAGGLLGAFVGYQHGLGDDPAEFVRYGVDAQWFFDLYKGSRTLALRGFLEGTARTGERIEEVPFVDLPRLGGPQLLRGYDLDRFRDRVVALTSVEYTYDLGMWASAFAFVDVGRPYRKLADFELADLRLGYGGGIQMHTTASMLARFHVASSIDGGLFVSLSLDPAFAPRARGEDVAVRVALCLAAVVTAACANSSPVGTLRFQNQPVVWRVNDRADVPDKPRERPYVRTLYHVDGYVVRRLTRAMELRGSVRARGVNALDEVPDSTWFTNRIGVRELSLDELRRGPATDEGPMPHKPWTVKGTKVGGTAVGFLIKDARGIKYLLKFDDKRGPEAETATHIIVQRILWACGFNVPDDRLVSFVRDDLIVADDASKKDVFGNKTPMTVADLEEGLAKVDRRADGSYRGLISKYLPGIPIGPYAREGRRKDDPNDYIAHEQLRSLRGQRPIFSWLNHTDLQEDNTLDVWETDPGDDGKHYVVHYLIDFGKALGVMGYLNRWNWVGHTMRVELTSSVVQLLSLGLYKRPWEDVDDTGLTDVGYFGVRAYDPGTWAENSPYWPLANTDRFDGFWGAKILMRFTPEQLRAIVEEGQLSDPRAIDYLVETLVARQRKTAAYWFRRVAPLDAFTVTPDGASHTLCFDDLSLRYELERAGGTRFRLTSYDYDGGATGWRQDATPGEGGHVCVGGLEASGSADGYLIVRIDMWRGHSARPATLVHLARDPATGALRIIGLRRR